MRTVVAAARVVAWALAAWLALASAAAPAGANGDTGGSGAQPSGVAAPPAASGASEPRDVSGAGGGSPAAAAREREIVIDIPSRTLALVEGGRVVARYPVAVGRPETPTPVGSFRIANKLRNPTWWAPARRGGEPVPPGPDNPLGPVWLGWDLPGYGIHGTIAPQLIGKAVSAGCVRLANPDAEAVFAWARVGTRVRITYERLQILPEAGGRLRLRALPDPYGRGAPPAAEIARRLGAAGLDAELAATLAPLVLAGLAPAAPGPVDLPVTAPVAVSVSGRPLAAAGFIADGRVHVPLRAVADALGLQAAWDTSTRTAFLAGVPLAAVAPAGRAYVSLRDLAAATGLAASWDPATHTAHLGPLPGP